MEKKPLKSLGGHLFSEDLCLPRVFQVVSTKQGNNGEKSEEEKLRYCGVNQLKTLG